MNSKRIEMSTDLQTTPFVACIITGIPVVENAAIIVKHERPRYLGRTIHYVNLQSGDLKRYPTAVVYQDMVESACTHFS